MVTLHPLKINSPSGEFPLESKPVHFSYKYWPVLYTSYRTIYSNLCMDWWSNQSTRFPPLNYKLTMFTVFYAFFIDIFSFIIIHPSILLLIFTAFCSYTHFFLTWFVNGVYSSCTRGSPFIMYMLTNARTRQGHGHVNCKVKEEPRIRSESYTLCSCVAICRVL